MQVWRMSCYVRVRRVGEINQNFINDLSISIDIFVEVYSYRYTYQIIICLFLLFLYLNFLLEGSWNLILKKLNFFYREWVVQGKQFGYQLESYCGCMNLNRSFCRDVIQTNLLRELVRLVNE